MRSSRPPAEGLHPRYRADDAVLLGLTALSATLLLANLGNRYLWQDEAQTALLARTIVEHGIPFGTDGRNSFSQELGVEIGPDGIWRWHTWLSFYAVAASFALLGESAFAARLPFALLGVGCVLLCWTLARELWRDRVAAAVGAGLLALSVPFLLMARQSRWYSLAAFLALAGLLAYARIRRREWRFALAFLAAALLLFHTHYLYCAVLLGSCCLHALLFERDKLPQTLAAASATTLLALPWLVWLFGVELGDDYRERLVDPSQSLSYLRTFSQDLLTVFLASGLWLLALPLLVYGSVKRGEPAWPLLPGAWSGVALVTLHAGVGIALLAVLSPGAYLRYLTPLVPPLFALAGLVVGALARAWPPVAGAALVAFVVTEPLDEFAHELTHDYDGPIEGIVRFLGEHARPGDTVAIVYGDLPVKFYTGLRVIGGLTGEDIEAARGADWIILRRHLVSSASHAVRARLREFVAAGDYRRRTIPYPDAAFESREDVRAHRFRTARLPGVVIWEKRR